MKASVCKKRRRLWLSGYREGRAPCLVIRGLAFDDLPDNFIEPTGRSQETFLQHCTDIGFRLTATLTAGASSGD